MNSNNNRRLTSSEITNLFTQFLQETLSICICKHVLATVKDSQVHSIYKISLELSEKNLKKLKVFFRNENVPIPNGLTDKDVNLNAPPLFSDSFWLEYLFTVVHFGISGLDLAFSVTVRKDIRDFYYHRNIEAMDLYNQVLDLLLSKGLHEPAPFFAVPKQIRYAANLGYTLDVIGHKRPLNIAEAGNIHFNLRMTCMAKGLFLGFSQVTKSKEIRQYLESCLNIVNKNFGIFSSILGEENLRVPRLLDTDVTNSAISPFSDKFIIHKVGFLTGLSLSYYGTAMAVSMRADIVAHCEAAILRGMKLMPGFGSIVIKNGWLEIMPDANDRMEIPND